MGTVSHCRMSLVYVNTSRVDELVCCATSRAHHGEWIESDEKKGALSLSQTRLLERQTFGPLVGYHST